MKADQNVSILVVTHNHEQYISKLIQSLEKFNYTNVYFCDAASKDNTVKILQNSSFKNKVLLKNELEGFAKNNNDLIRHYNLKSDYYLLLNPDTYFTKDFLSILVCKMQEDRLIGITSPLTYYPDNTLQITWKKFPSFWNVIKKRLGLMKSKDEKQVSSCKIDWALGACLLIDKRLFKENGMLLDERYRLYCEDIDICFECKTKKLKILGVEEAFIYHHLNELSSKNIFSKYNYWNLMSILKFLKKWNFKYFFRNV